MREHDETSVISTLATILQIRMMRKIVEKTKIHFTRRRTWMLVLYIETIFL